MTIRRQGKAAAPRNTLPDLSGPPDIVLVPVLDASGQVLREPLAVTAEWADPDDLGRYGKHARRVKGTRRVWLPDTLHKRSPADMTAEMLKACDRLLSDYELGVEGARRGGGAASVRVDCSTIPGAEDGRLNAMRDYRAAQDVLPSPTNLIVIWGVVSGGGTERRPLTLEQIAERIGGGVAASRRRFLDGCRLLADHYWPAAQRATIAPVKTPAEGADREGRWR